MNDLVTVTCNLDKKQLLLQAESISKFLEPCTHWIIINEANPNISSWEKYLSPFYKKHDLKLISRDDLFKSESFVKGYHLQNVCKLEIGKLIKNDYLILDTKNFFIKPASIKEWDSYIGSTTIEFSGPPPEDYNKFQPNKFGNNKVWREALECYSVFFKKEIPNYFLCPATPFKIDYGVLKQVFDKNINLYSAILFKSDGEMLNDPSEFIFYSFLINKKIYHGINTILNMELNKSYTAGFKKNFNFDYELVQGNLFKNVDYSNVKVFGIHRNLIDNCDPGHIEIINNYLAEKNFQFKF